MPNQPSAKPHLLFYSDSRYYSGAEKIFDLSIKGLTEDYPDSLVMLTPETTQLKLRLDQIWHIRRLIRQHNCQVAIVNMWSPYANTLGLLAARLAGIPSITIFHYYQEASALRGPLAPLKRLAYRLAGRLSWKIVAVSKAHQKILVNDFRLPAEKVSVIHNGIIRQGEPITTFNQPRRFLSVGTLEANKGQSQLLEIMAKLDGNWRLSLVGDGPDRELLAEQLNRLQLGDKVSLLGRQTDMPSIYRQHHILLHPSHSENLSVAITEALAYGLPVVANRVGGNPELIRGEEGWLLPHPVADQLDQTAWLEVLNQIMTMDNQELQQRSQAATERFEQNFQLADMLEKYRSLINQAHEFNQ